MEKNSFTQMSQIFTNTPIFSVKVRHLFIKRIFDIFFSIIALVLGFPIFLIIALAIKSSSKGPIFYAHERIGRGGIPFHCYKFRTMYFDADKRLHAILAADEEKRKEWEMTRKLKKDPRVIPLGQFLRKTSLDETPQFWNVVKGDLSIVGPRPVVKEELIKYFGTKANKILSIRPGLTGLWQVSGRSHTSYEKRIALDEEYIDRRSFWLDLKLIILTIPQMFSKKGAY